MLTNNPRQVPAHCRYTIAPARPNFDDETRSAATTIELGGTFYPSEDYHQDYLTRHPRAPYILRRWLSTGFLI